MVDEDKVVCGVCGYDLKIEVIQGVRNAYPCKLCFPEYANMKIFDWREGGKDRKLELGEGGG